NDNPGTVGYDMKRGGDPFYARLPPAPGLGGQSRREVQKGRRSRLRLSPTRSAASLLPYSGADLVRTNSVPSLWLRDEAGHADHCIISLTDLNFPQLICLIIYSFMQDIGKIRLLIFILIFLKTLQNVSHVEKSYSPAELENNALISSLQIADVKLHNNPGDF
ncbi:hypothetical protein BHE74_00005707, partial [Ensete ventricosum]